MRVKLQNLSVTLEAIIQVTTYANEAIVKVIADSTTLVELKMSLEECDQFQSDLYDAYDTLSNQEQ